MLFINCMSSSYEFQFVDKKRYAILALATLSIISVIIPISILVLKRDFTKGTITILTWGEMKWAISVALALSIADITIRETILFMTY